jgi:hypothetical protein
VVFGLCTYVPVAGLTAYLGLCALAQMLWLVLGQNTG